MAEKDFSSGRRRGRWMLLLIPLVLLALAGMAIFLIPTIIGSSQSKVQATSKTGLYLVRTPPPPPTCTATVKIDKSWSGGFQATVTVKNTGEQALNTWMIYWGLPAGVHFVKGWNANVFQDGDVIMAHPFDTNRTFPAGGTRAIGFEASGPTDQPIEPVMLNGIACAR
jgi:cellulase/cellobiase CelA1